MMIYGVHAVEGALSEGKAIEKIYIQMGLKNDRLSHIAKLSGQQYVPVQRVPSVKLSKLTRHKHQGVIAVISPIKFYNTGQILMQVFDRGEVPLFMVLDNITDTRNFGAILRSAASMKVNGVIIPTKGAAKITPESVKASAGGLLTIPICREPDLKNTIKYLKESGLYIVAATEKAEQPIHKIDLTGPIAIVLGAEGEGINQSLLAMVDAEAAIPIAGNIGSLNVSVAAGIVLYEVSRQRG